MVATNDRTVTVFGGTGFLGRRIVRHLRSHGFPVRTASRHPDRGHRLFGPDNPQLQSVRANIHDERSVADALAGAYGVVNAVSLYVEHGQETFHSVHVVWHALAWSFEIFPNPLLTRNQVELMQIDTVSSPEKPGFVEVGISPHSVEAILQKMLSNCR